MNGLNRVNHWNQAIKLKIQALAFFAAGSAVTFLPALLPLLVGATSTSTWALSGIN
jgi:hypothetical protein